jgi:hypothetical protein
MRLALTNETGNVTDADAFYNIDPAAILKSNTKRDPTFFRKNRFKLAKRAKSQTSTRQ